MGILADFFVASREDAANLADTSTLERDDVYESSRVTEVDLEELVPLLVSSGEADGEFEIVRNHNEGEQITCMFPEVLVDSLAAIREDELPGLAEAWLAGLDYDGVTGSLEELLTELVRLAKLAKEYELSLFLWNSV